MKIIRHKRKAAITECEARDERKDRSVSVHVVNNRGEPMDTSFDLVTYVKEIHSLVRE